MPTQLQPRAQPPVLQGPEPAGISIEGVSRTYSPRGGAPVQALAELSLHAEAGELLAVVGPSGCGKSTLLELLCRLQTPDGGSIACPPAVLMPQRDLLLAWLSALDNAALALRIAGLSRSRARARAAALFAELGLAGFERMRPHEASGGMRQRVAFLRTLLSGKPVLCLDEPFGALDAITRAEMQEWLAATLAGAPRTVVLVTHDVEEAILLADRLAVLSPRPGRVLAQLEVDLQRPRARTDSAVIALRERVLEILTAGLAGVIDAASRGDALAAGAQRGGASRSGALLGAAARALPAIVLGGLLLGAWELYVDISRVEADLLPAPHAVAVALWQNLGLLSRNFAVTAEEVVLGLCLALAAGFALAVAIHVFPLLRRAVYPLAVGSQAVPIPVIGVLLVFWWGFGLFPKLVVVALICFFPIVVTTVDGLRAVDPEQPKLLRTLDASRWQALRFAELPAALPAALSGARIALAVGVIGAFIAETTTPTTGAYPGLGREIITDVNFQTPRAYAGTALLIAFALACFYALALAERQLAPWSTTTRGEPR